MNTNLYKKDSNFFSGEKRHLNFEEDFQADFYADAAGASVGAGMGGGQMAAAPKATVSSPIILNIVNGTTAVISDVSILYSAKNATLTGNGIATGITITSGVANISYQTLLNILNGTDSFEIGRIYLNSTNSSQVAQSFNIVQYDYSGQSTTFPMYPTQSANQFQATILEFPSDFRLTSMTGITFSSILASATLTFRLEPKLRISLAHSLASGSVEQRFSKSSLAGNMQTVKMINA